MKKAQVFIEYLMCLLFGILLLLTFVACFQKQTTPYIKQAGGGSLWAKFQHNTIHVRPMTK